MAGSSLLALIDDIATLLDDIAVMSKVAAQKTAGVLGDDLALNAQQIIGIKPERELPVVWAVCVGSLRNKVILVPAALAISAFIPWLVLPLLMLGGCYLCFEGCEKLAHKFFHGAEDAQHHAEELAALSDPNVDMLSFEKAKIKGAIRTDFILSAEIIVIALGTVSAQPLLQQSLVLSLIAVVMTVGVYGLVAAIVKLDDIGLYLNQLPGQGAWRKLQRTAGQVLLTAAPKLMKTLSVLGTAAMFLVGGSIILHGIPAAHHVVEWLEHATQPLTLIGPMLAWLIAPLLGILTGLLTGAMALSLVRTVGKVF
jgi:uncharacterized protein